MGLVQYFVILLLSAQLVLTSPVTEQICIINGRRCNMCPAGAYHKSGECEPCPAGSFITDRNCEDSCERCFGNCRPDYHLKVVQNCTSTSNLKCVCEAGYKCSEKVRYTENCRSCVKIQQKNPTVKVVTSRNDKQMPSSISSGHSNTSAKPCRNSKCGPQSVPPTPKEDMMNSQLVAILCPVVVMGCMALVILLCIRQSRDGNCFKRAIGKLCNEGRQASASYKSKESSHQFPRDSFSAKQQPPSVSAANLGPVHFHNPGTVIFSLLSQFTGQVGPTVEGEKTAEKASTEEDEETDGPVCHPTSSPSLHLSEEERSGEIDSIFFPSQEQGKDCHLSKEEEL